jgi:hypothetical protein
MSITLRKTTDKITTNDYPYGRLRCTATWELEFNDRKGFRTVFQTINPKTGRLNAPKKSTYSPIIVLTQDNITGFTSTIHLSLNGVPELNKGLNFVDANFDLFTAEQIEYIYTHVAAMIKVSWYAVIGYCGADKDAAKELFEPHFRAALRGIKEGGNKFQECKIDVDKYNTLKDPNFKLFG